MTVTTHTTELFPGVQVPVVPKPPATKRLLDTGPSKAGSHRLQDALTCPALYRLTRVPRRGNPAGEPAVVSGRGPLVRGTIGHIALAQHYARAACEAYRGPGAISPDEFYEPHQAIDIAADARGALGDEFRGLIHRVYDEYQAFYAVDRQKIVAVEYPVEVTIDDPRKNGKSYLFTQRWDLLTQDTSGRYWITDHKFVADAGISTVNGYALSVPFIAAAHLGWQVFGKDFGGVILNLIGVGSTPAKFVRTKPPPSPAAVRNFPATVAHGEEIIRWVESIESEDDVPRHYGETTCNTRYGLCDCWLLCRYGRDHIDIDGRRL